MRVLVTGATGYIGGRLIPRLLKRGHEVRVLVRDHTRLAQREWVDRVDIVEGDLSRPDGSWNIAMSGIDAAYYLVHSMSAGRGFAERDRIAALNFSDAAHGIPHVIYLGGLQPSGETASEHLASRAEVGEILRRRLPVTELRAGPIIGSGSASFEMVRYLVDRVPLVVAPGWIDHEIQPIGVRDILSYLILSLDRNPIGVLEVGGNRLTFRDMLLEYARVRKLRRVVASIPFLPLVPRLPALLTALITPVPFSLALPLIKGMMLPVVANPGPARDLFPEVQPISYRRAVKLALRRIKDGNVETRWSGALGIGPTYELHDWEGMIREVRSIHVQAEPARVSSVLTSLGGDTGWLVWNWAWRLRGLIDRLLGGPGLRRGRRHPSKVMPGEAIDFWRVEAIGPSHLLRLRAEMKVPGRAWLEWSAIPDGGGTRLVQRALFAPAGLGGLIYWHALYPIHKKIFSDLIRAIAARSTSQQ